MKDLLFRARRKAAQFVVRRNFTGSGPGGTDKTSLVLYLDYEREFGHQQGRESAETGFRGILDVLSGLGIRATWNCVGLISEHYPDTLSALVAAGQELASHTYHHVDLMSVPAAEVRADLHQVRDTFAARYGAEVVGLHPPRDRWPLYLPGLLNEHGYRYLIAREEDPRRWHTHYLKLPRGREILCIPSLADDWGYIDRGFGAAEMHRFLSERLSLAGPGRGVAFGFHPWVVGASRDRLESFAVLMRDLAANPRFELVTAREMVDWYAR